MPKKRPLAVEVGSIIRAARKAARMSGRELIERAGITSINVPLISRYETGMVLPALDRLEKLLAACGAEVSTEIRDKYLVEVEANPNHMHQIIDVWTNFVTVWQTSGNVGEVAEKLRLTERQVSNKVARARRNGVPLKRMPRRKKTNNIPWPALAELAESLLTSEPQDPIERE